MSRPEPLPYSSIPRQLKRHLTNQNRSCPCRCRTAFLQACRVPTVRHSRYTSHHSCCAVPVLPAALPNMRGECRGGGGGQAAAPSLDLPEAPVRHPTLPPPRLNSCQLVMPPSAAAACLHLRTALTAQGPSGLQQHHPGFHPGTRTEAPSSPSEGKARRLGRRPREEDERAARGTMPTTSTVRTLEKSQYQTTRRRPHCRRPRQIRSKGTDLQANRDGSLVVRCQLLRLFSISPARRSYDSKLAIRS